MLIHILKQFFIYASGALILRSVNVVLAPLTLRILTPAEYGLIALAYNFISIAVVCLGFGLRQVFGLEFFHHEGSARHTMLNDIIIIYLLLATPLILIALFNHTTIATIFFNHAVPALFMPIILGICFLHFFIELIYQCLQYHGYALLLTTLQITTALATIALNLSLLLVMRAGLISPLLAQLAVMSIVCTISTLWYWYRQPYDYSPLVGFPARARRYLKQGLPFIPSMLCAWLVSSADRWVLARYTTLHEVGIYSLADTFGQLFNMLILYPMSGSYIPAMLASFAARTTPAHELVARNIRYMCHSMLLVAVGITGGYVSMRWFLYWILPPAYHEAIHYIWLLLMGYVFLMGTYFATIPLQFHKHTLFLAASLIVPAVINITLNILLVPHSGIYGCVLATVIAYAFYFALTLWYSMKQYYYPRL